MSAERRSRRHIAGRDATDGDPEPEPEVVTEDGEIIPRDDSGSRHVIFEEPPIG